MYKSRLQELCQRRRWRAPEYTVARDGLDHDPRFRATVSVGDAAFNSPCPAKSAKEAQNSAAQAAFEHLIAAPPPPPVPSPAPAPVSHPTENHIPVKTQLQSYAHGNCLDPPRYDYVREGPPHNPRFKATVRVDGQTFESLSYFNTLKEAEHDAAKVALASLPLEEIKEVKDESGLYKNLLQEMARKEGFSLPIYKTVVGGVCHMPTFSSIVEIEGESFHGDVAKTKRQAENSAAKVAWHQLKECAKSKSSGGCAMSCGVQESHLPASSSTAEVMNFQQPRALSHAKRWMKIEEGVIGLFDKEQGDDSSKKMKDGNDSVAVLSSKEIIDNSNQSVISFEELNSEFATKKEFENNALYEDVISVASESGYSSNHSVSAVATDRTQDGQPPVAANSKEDTMTNTSTGNGISSSPPSSGSSDCGLIDSSNVSSMESMTCSLLCNRVRVYPCKPDLVLPKGATTLPFSDDMWVAVSLDFSHHEGDKHQRREKDGEEAF